MLRLSLLQSVTESVLGAALRGRPVKMGLGSLFANALAFEHSIEILANGIWEASGSWHAGISQSNYHLWLIVTKCKLKHMS